MSRQYFYFTRTAPPPLFAGKYLVSGVVEAVDEEAAVAALGAALKDANSRDDAQNFGFRALPGAGAAPVNPHGILAITTAEEV